MIKSDIQIRFSDIDSFEHVNNINIQHYYDYGKMMYYNDVLKISVSRCNPSLVLVNTTSNYFSSILCDDSISVETSVVKLGQKSITFYQRIIDNKTSEVKSDCTTVMVAIDREKNCSTLLLPDWIVTICNQEQKTTDILRKDK